MTNQTTSVNHLHRAFVFPEGDFSSAVLQFEMEGLQEDEDEPVDCDFYPELDFDTDNCIDYEVELTEDDIPVDAKVDFCKKYDKSLSRSECIAAYNIYWAYRSEGQSNIVSRHYAGLYFREDEEL